MIPGDSSESLTEDGPVPGYDDEGNAVASIDGSSVTAALVAAEEELCAEGDRLMRSIDGSTP